MAQLVKRGYIYPLTFMPLKMEALILKLGMLDLTTAKTNFSIKNSFYNQD